EAGYVTYSNDAKIHELKVSEEVVETFGAVSVATAWAMARGALATTDADIAVAITGIARPGGATAAQARGGGGRGGGTAGQARGGVVVCARAPRRRPGQDRRRPEAVR